MEKILCGFIAFTGVLLGLVRLAIYGITGVEPKTVIDWILIAIYILSAIVGTILTIVL